MNTRSMWKHGIIRELNPSMILKSMIFNCFLLQVQGGSISQETVSDSTIKVFDCRDHSLIELYPGAGFPICVNSTWECPYEGMCYSFTYNQNYNDYEYYCGPCGGIGSRCDPDKGMTCNSPGRCRNGAFCRCPDSKDFEQGAICKKLDPVSLPPSFYILLILLIFIILLNKIIKCISRGDTFQEIWERRRNYFCCLHSTGSDSDDETSIVGVNERSGEKSASYTISGNEFMATSDDPDLEWALELSRTMRQSNGEWIEGSASVRSVRPRRSNRSQPSRRRSAMSIQSVESVNRSIQEDVASFKSCKVESIPDDCECARCPSHHVQRHECASSASTTHDFDNMPSTSSSVSTSKDLYNIPSTSQGNSIQISLSSSNVSYRIRNQTEKSMSSTSDDKPSTSDRRSIQSTSSSADRRMSSTSDDIPSYSDKRSIQSKSSSADRRKSSTSEDMPSSSDRRSIQSTNSSADRRMSSTSDDIPSSSDRRSIPSTSSSTSSA